MQFDLDPDNSSIDGSFSTADDANSGHDRREKSYVSGRDFTATEPELNNAVMLFAASLFLGRIDHEDRDIQAKINHVARELDQLSLECLSSGCWCSPNGSKRARTTSPGNLRNEEMSGS